MAFFGGSSFSLKITTTTTIIIIIKIRALAAPQLWRVNFCQKSAAYTRKNTVFQFHFSFTGSNK
jgi:hypothetical protein